MSRMSPTPEQRIAQLELELATTRQSLRDTRARLYRTASILRSALVEVSGEIVAMNESSEPFLNPFKGTVTVSVNNHD